MNSSHNTERRPRWALGWENWSNAWVGNWWAIRKLKYSASRLWMTQMRRTSHFSPIPSFGPRRRTRKRPPLFYRLQMPRQSAPTIGARGLWQITLMPILPGSRNGLQRQAHPVVAGIDATAHVDASATIAATAFIGPHVTIEADAWVADHAVIEAGCFIGRGAKIGAAPIFLRVLHSMPDVKSGSAALFIPAR